MENLYLRDSPLTPISHKIQNFILNESYVVNFVLKDMDSFENIERRETFAQLIKELEKIKKYGMGKKATNLWIRDYEKVY